MSKKKKFVSAECFLHWKQGDDFAGFLEVAGGDVAEAFGLWAQAHQDRMYQCQRISETLKGMAVAGHGDTHHIGLEAADQRSSDALAKLIASEDLLTDPFEDDEDDEEFEESLENVGDDGESEDESL